MSSFNKELKDTLLKEAESRVRQPIKTASKKGVMPNGLLHEAELRLSRIRMASLEKTAMPAHIGDNRLSNSEANVTWQMVDPSARIQQIEKDISEQFTPYAYAFVGGKKVQLPSAGAIHLKDEAASSKKQRPATMVLRFMYSRDIFPIHDEAAMKNVESSLDLMEQVIPGFGAFIEAIKGASIPLLPYYHTTMQESKEGGVRQSEARDFISLERERLQQEPLVTSDGDDIGSGRFYADHSSSEVLPSLTNRYKRSRRFSNDDLEKENTPGSLLRRLAYKIRLGYWIDWDTLSNAVEKNVDYWLEYHGLSRKARREDRKRLVQLYQNTFRDTIDKINSAFNRGQKEIEGSPGKNDLYHWGKYDEGHYEGLRPGNNDLPVSVLRLALQHLTQYDATASLSKINENHPNFIGPNENTDPGNYQKHASNGFDSHPSNPEVSMLLMPAVKKLPHGEIVYNTDQGNMGRTHLLSNWHSKKTGGMGQLISKWGAWAKNSLDRLQSPEVAGSLMDASEGGNPYAFDAWAKLIGYQNDGGNRTNAENVLEMLRRYPDWTSFSNYLQSSLSAGIASHSKFSGSGANAPLNVPPGQFAQSEQQALINQSGGLISRLEQGDQDPELKKQIEAIEQGTINNLTNYAGAWTSVYDEGEIGWDQYVNGLNELNNVLGHTGRPVAGLISSITKTQEDSMIDPQGFEAYQQFGYQVAKMMDFVDGLRTRATETILMNDDKGKQFNQHFFGENLSSSTGKSDYGMIMVGIKYAFNIEDGLGSHDTELSTMVHEQIGKQRTIQRGVDVQRETENPQQGQEAPAEFQDPSKTTKVVEEVMYWIGQASSGSDWYKELDSNLTWGQAVEQFQERYPDIQRQLGNMIEPINVNLKRLENASKKMMSQIVDRVRSETGSQGEVVYVNSAGIAEVLNTETLEARSMALDAQEQEALSGSNIDMGQHEVPETLQAPQEAAPVTEVPARQPQAVTPSPQQVAPPLNQTPTPNFNVPSSSNTTPVPDPVDENSKSMDSQFPVEAPKYIGRRQKGRRLIKKDISSRASAVARLEKMATQFDRYGQSHIAAKLDMLLHKMIEDGDV